MSFIAPGITYDHYMAGSAKPIDIFERRIKGWTLAFANNLAEQDNSGVAVLLLASSVLQPMGGALLGNEAKTNTRMVIAGLKWVFPRLSDDSRKRVCHLLRDGLFHKSFIQAGLVLKQLDEPIKVEAGAIFIDPVRFVKSVDVSFSRLCDEIRSESNRINRTFAQYWEADMSDERKYWKGNFSEPLRLQAGATISPAAGYMPDPALMTPDGPVEIDKTGRK